MALNTSVLTAVKPTSKPEITTLLDNDTLIVFRGNASNLQMFRFKKQSLVDFITNIGGSGQSLDTTDDLAEGSTNFYFTDNNLINAFANQVVTTNDLAEGTEVEPTDNNRYFTEERVYRTFQRVILSSSDGTTGTQTFLANETLTGEIDFANMYYVLKITTLFPARVRFYIRFSYRDQDLNRAIGVDPTGDHGLLLEFVSTTGNLTKYLTPAVLGYNDTNYETTISYSITNLDTVTRSSVFEFEVVKLNEPIPD